MERRLWNERGECRGSAQGHSRTCPTREGRCRWCGRKIEHALHPWYSVPFSPLGEAYAVMYEPDWDGLDIAIAENGRWLERWNRREGGHY